jgi:hypothetical protein
MNAEPNIYVSFSAGTVAMRRQRSLTIAVSVSLWLAVALPLGAQLVQQSQLTPEDVDPDFRLTIDLISQDNRWLGLAPRQITWSPDGEWVYFRWREDPEPDQHSSTDPWYAASRDGRHVRQVPDSEVVSIPTGSIEWSLNRQRAAWSNGGNLFVWDARDGTRIVHTAGGSLLRHTGGRLSIARTGGPLGVRREHRAHSAAGHRVRPIEG